MADDDVKKPQFELTDEGNVVRNHKGKAILLATFMDESGDEEGVDEYNVITFESDAIDAKYRAQIIRCIVETTEGELTGNVIHSYRIKGRPVDERKKNEPPMPKFNKMLGDKDPARVKWYFKWRPQEAYVRYGVLLDKSEEPQTHLCARAEQGLVQPDNGKPLKVFGNGQDALSTVVIVAEEGILARRATCMTFLLSERHKRDAEDNLVRLDGDEEEAE